MFQRASQPWRFCNFLKIKELLDDETFEFKIGVNSVALDGKYKALPQNYRMSDGERLEVYKPLSQDPKERRKAKADLKES